MENNLSFDRHIRNKGQIVHVQLRNLTQIRKHNQLKFGCMVLFLRIFTSATDYFLTFLLNRAQLFNASLA